MSPRTIRGLGWLPVVAYAIGLEIVAPRVVSRGLAWIWWLAIVGLLFAMYRLWAHPRAVDEENEKHKAITASKTDFALLGITLFLYDPTIQPFLARFQLSRLWLVTLAMLFVHAFYLLFRESRRS